MSDKVIAGVDFSGANKIPNDTWMAVGRLSGWQFQIADIRKIGSHALAAELNKTHYAAVGIDVPFSLPTEFISFLAQRETRKDFQSWQELAEFLVFCSFDTFVEAAKEFKKEPKRVTDKSTTAPAQSPLHRGYPSMIQMTYQGIRLLASLDPTKFSVIPFQEPSTNRCTVLEVYPRDLLKVVSLPDTNYKSKTKAEEEAIVKVRRQILGGLSDLRERKNISLRELVRISIPKEMERMALESDHALDAIVAAYTTALYVSKPELFSDPFAQDDLAVLLEGWIYALKKFES